MTMRFITTLLILGRSRGWNHPFVITMNLIDSGNDNSLRCNRLLSSNTKHNKMYTFRLASSSRRKTRMDTTLSAISEQSRNSMTYTEKDRNRYASYLKRAVSIVESYPFQHQPFSLFLKQYLANDKRLGSQDRRKMRHYCYPYFRLGHAFQHVPTDEKILLALYLTDMEDPLISIMRPQWLNRSTHLKQPDSINCNDHDLLSIASKIPLGYSLSTSDIFPFTDICLSNGIRKDEWIYSMLVQPHLFIRIRPGKYNTFISQLQTHGITWRPCDLVPNCILMPSSTNLDFVQDTIEKTHVIQDYSSQRVGQLFNQLRDKNIQTIWDCCAGSGGKSLLAMDTLFENKDFKNSNIRLTVSDKRASILNQLRKRFTAANVRLPYHVLELDLEIVSQGDDSNTDPAIKDHQDKFPHETFDLVIADVPCSGSGTWARTPEQLCCFKPQLLDDFVSKQRRILATLPKAVKPNGYLIYCTCSVFEKENEAQVAWFAETFDFVVEHSIVFNGLEHGADTLFASLMRKT